MTGRELCQSSSVTSGEGRNSRREQDYSSNLLPGSSRRGRTGIKVKQEPEPVNLLPKGVKSHAPGVILGVYQIQEGEEYPTECLSPYHPRAHNLVALARNCCKLSATDTDTHKSAREEWESNCCGGGGNSILILLILSLLLIRNKHTQDTLLLHTN